MLKFFNVEIFYVTLLMEHILLENNANYKIIDNPIYKYFLTYETTKYPYLGEYPLANKKPKYYVKWHTIFNLENKKDQAKLFNNKHFYPKTYLLPEELKVVLKLPQNMFYKIGLSSQGFGVYMNYDKNINFDIAQEAIESFTFQNRKVDFRVYVFIGRIAHKFSFFFYKDVLVKTSQNLYDFNSTNRITQLTNTAQLINDHFNYQFLLSELPFYKLFINKIKKLLLEIKNVVVNQTMANNEFNLFGFDIIFDKNLKPYLLELNSSPNYIKDINPDNIKQMKKNMVNSMLTILIPSIFTHEEEKKEQHEWIEVI